MSWDVPFKRFNVGQFWTTKHYDFSFSMLKKQLWKKPKRQTKNPPLPPPTQNNKPNRKFFSHKEKQLYAQDYLPPTMQILCLKGMETLARHLPHSSKKVDGKEKIKDTKSYKLANYQEGLEGLQKDSCKWPYLPTAMTCTLETKLFLVGPDFLIFGIFIASMLLLQILRKTPTY